MRLFKGFHTFFARNIRTDVSESHYLGPNWGRSATSETVPTSSSIRSKSSGIS